MMRRFLAVTMLTVFAAGLFATVPPSAQADGLTWRVSEPIVVTGAELGHFDGVPVDAIGVWILEGESWTRVPSQVDQRDDEDAFVPEEDGDVLDENDELVFMADPLGGGRPDGAWPPGVSREKTPAQIKVTDPLEEDYIGYAYVFEGPPAAEETPLVSYDDGTGEISSDAYTLGLAQAEDGFFGLKRLSLMGDERDRLDRSKLRITIPAFGEFNEETLGQFGGIGLLEPVIEGPVRLVMSADGGAMAYAARATLINFDFGFDIPLIPGLEVRVSLDFSPEASGATYRAQNVPSGVTIDGAPDTVLPIPFPMWREVQFEEGRFVQLAEAEPPLLLVRTYYKDDATLDDTDTGDQMSYGDNGIVANSLQGLSDVGFLGQMVAVSNDNPVTAEELAEQMANPIVIEIEVEAKVSALYCPLTLR